MFRKNNNLLEYWKGVVTFIDNIAEKENRDANYFHRSWWHQSSTLGSDYALTDTNIGKRTTGPHWDGVALVKPVLCQKGGTLLLTLARTGGGGCNPPWGFSRIAKKTAARSAAGFWATLWGKPSAIFGKKKFDRVRSGHGAMTSQRGTTSGNFTNKVVFSRNLTWRHWCKW